MKVFDRRYEMMPRAELEQLQLERLQALLVRLRRSVRRYREILAEASVKSLGDLARLPFTTPEDVAASFPYGMFALPLREVSRLHSMVGPQGKPIVIGHTRNDLAQWGRLVARQLVAGGVTAHDIIQVCFGGGVYRGASGYGLAAECIEASIIAEDPHHIENQMAMLQNYRPTILITTPANAKKLIRLMDERRIDPQSLSLRTVLLSHPVDRDTRDQLKAGLFADVRCNFGIGEILDPGLCIECEAGQFHANEDHFLVEAVEGELVVTTLCREAMPLLRYRTRVACEIRREKCQCGRTGVVLVPGKRLDGQLNVAGMPLYPDQIAEILNHTRAGGHEYRAEVQEQSLEISIRVTADLFGDTVLTLEPLAETVRSEFLTRFGIEAHVHFVTQL